ncbi:MAG TPA: hypothetical protein VMJ93_02910 [Verrucomicrobiae bacterium]|nr:hypothetical protein [Verrucomicrobiae bacterium]
MTSLPGRTVQCLNPDCGARGRWVRLLDLPQETCPACGGPLHNVPPPLQPLRLRARPRTIGNYRPRLLGRRGR